VLADLRYRLRALFQRREMARQLAAELRLHRELEVAKLTSQGLSPAAAERQARLSLHVQQVDGPDDVGARKFYRIVQRPIDM
jgi:hypothetical protein